MKHKYLAFRYLALYILVDNFTGLLLNPNVASEPPWREWTTSQHLGVPPKVREGRGESYVTMAPPPQNSYSIWRRRRAIVIKVGWMENRYRWMDDATEWWNGGAEEICTLSQENQEREERQFNASHPTLLTATCKWSLSSACGNFGTSSRFVGLLEPWRPNCLIIT